MQARFDGEWTRRAREGDAGALRLLAEEATGPVFSFCLPRLGGDRSACEDVVQETLVRALRDLAAYDPERSGGDIFGWLTGLARNEIRRARTEGRRAVSLDALWARVDGDLARAFDAIDTQPLPDEVLDRAETRALVHVAMSQLPSRYRDVLEAKYVAGRSVREMAAAIGDTEKAVESALGRARAAFRAAFDSISRRLPAGPGA